MNITLEFQLFALCLFLSVITCLSAESSTCLMVYKEGGAPAVFKSPKCPRWKLSDHNWPPKNSMCHFAVHQGRRKSQEDRIVCALDIRIPFPGPSGFTEVAVGIMAVFDGHNGSEASDLASKLLLEYFLLHTYFLLDATFPSFLKKFLGTLSDREVVSFSSRFLKDRELILHFINQERHISQEMFGESFHLEILKEALLRTIADIDTTFSKEAKIFHFDSGSTATVILIVDGQILVANLGDSKALMCSEQYQPPADAKATALRIYMQKRRIGEVMRFKDCESCKMVGAKGSKHLVVKELTRDHRPDRDDEKFRVENAGGYVIEWNGVSRVNGRLAVSRAIGDVFFKSYGVIAAPEISGWRPLNDNDSYLIAASDGVFEGLDTQDVCDLLWEVQNDDPSESHVSSACSDSLADCIISTAFERGSADNIAVAVVPLRLMNLSKTSLNVEEVPISLVKLEHAYPIVAKFDRLLVEGKQGNFACYYLYENLKENDEDTFCHPENVNTKDAYGISHALPGCLEHSCGESLKSKEENKFCFHFGMISDKIIDEGRYPEDLSSFLALLESIPLQHAESSFGSFEHVKSDMRYILRKRFGRGAYGEVWLAFQWNCSRGDDAHNWNKNNITSSSLNLESCDEYSGNFSSSHDCPSGSTNGNSFILKRIMVERGSSVYLSGLREKYFGEIFLNASTSLGGSLLSTTPGSFFGNPRANVYDPFGTDKIAFPESEDSVNSMFSHGNETWAVFYEEGLNHIARYVESFESGFNEIWLVFRHEGISLSKLMYTTKDDKISSESAGHAQVLHPSKWWHWLKTTKAGQEEMRNLIKQLLLALKSCHDRNITHRDIKPENMVICIEDQYTGECFKGRTDAELEHAGRMRVIDFGSAIDDFTMRRLYGYRGPSRAEQTYEYTPPEALLNTSWFQGPTNRTLKYDMWSVGVVFLEMVLGSPDVFQISSLSQVLLDKLLQGWNEDLKELAYRLRSFMEMCILIPGHSTLRHPGKGSRDQANDSPASWKCSEEFFSNLIKSRDPLNIGFPNIWAMRLVRQLLRWDPDDRSSVDDALQHPYFQLHSC